MKRQGHIATPLLVLSLLISTVVEADENQYQDTSLQLAQNMNVIDRDALREQLRKRMREISPAEQSLMRDSAYDGRKRLENSEETRLDQRSGRNEGSGYGRGLESRQVGDISGASIGGGRGGNGGGMSSGGGGMGSSSGGMGGSGGGGRGR